MSINVGDRAPDFDLIDSDLKPRKLSEFRGQKVVLLFFPGAFTDVCTKELCTVRDSMMDFNNVGAQVLAVSVDQPFSQARFKTENNFVFTLLSDFDRKVGSKYGAQHSDFLGVIGMTVEKRAAFVIDKDGVVRYAWVSEDPKVEPNYSEIKNIVTGLS
jgi:peroxiredoxin